jgi:hypothetical protein
VADFEAGADVDERYNNTPPHHSGGEDDDPLFARRTPRPLGIFLLRYLHHILFIFYIYFAELFDQVLLDDKPGDFDLHDAFLRSISTLC